MDPLLTPTGQTILVQGATGNTGFATITALLSHPHTFKIRAGVHDLSKIDKLTALGPQMDVVQLDTEYPQTVHAALQGVNKLMVCPPNTVDRVGASKLLIQAAVDAGVKHIVLISILGADKCAVTFQKQFYAIEQYLERCEVAFTILRCPFFMEDFYFFAPYLLEGQVRLPIGADTTFMISTQDIGECAAVILASRETIHHRKYYNLSGPEPLDGDKMAEALSEGLGLPITYTNVSDVEAEDMFQRAGFEPSQAFGLIELFQLLSLGADEFVSQESTYLLGRPPVSLSVWAKEHSLFLIDRARTLQIRLPGDSIVRTTNEQGQQIVNQQGQQGSAYIKADKQVYFSPQSSSIHNNDFIPQQISPVFRYQRGSFPHLEGHTEQWNTTNYPFHLERRTKREYARGNGIAQERECTIS